MTLEQRIKLLDKGLSIEDTVVFEVIYSKQEEYRGLHEARVQASITQLEIAELLSIPATKVQRSIIRLIEFGLIIKHSRGTYLIKTK